MLSENTEVKAEWPLALQVILVAYFGLELGILEDQEVYYC